MHWTPWRWPTVPKNVMTSLLIRLTHGQHSKNLPRTTRDERVNDVTSKEDRSWQVRLLVGYRPDAQPVFSLVGVGNVAENAELWFITRFYCFQSATTVHKRTTPRDPSPAAYCRTSSIHLRQLKHTRYSGRDLSRSRAGAPSISLSLVPTSVGTPIRRLAYDRCNVNVIPAMSLTTCCISGGSFNLFNETFFLETTELRSWLAHNIMQPSLPWE
jgi:hypothetical protein